jgi:hypothetical protein
MRCPDGQTTKLCIAADSARLLSSSLRPALTRTWKRQPANPARQASRAAVRTSNAPQVRKLGLLRRSRKHIC